MSISIDYRSGCGLCVAMVAIVFKMTIKMYNTDVPMKLTHKLLTDHLYILLRFAARFRIIDIDMMSA